MRFISQTRKQGKWKYDSPLIPLRETNYFSPGIKLFGEWIKDENSLLKDIMEKVKICTIQELRRKTEQMVIDEWRYFQLKHFVTTLPQPIRSGEDL